MGTCPYITIIVGLPAGSSSVGINKAEVELGQLIVSMVGLGYIGLLPAIQFSRHSKATQSIDRVSGDDYN